MNSTEAVLTHHLEAFGEQDIQETMEDYTDESTVISQMETFQGKDEIRGMFEQLFAEFSNPNVTFSLDEQISEGDVAHIVWHAETPDNNYEFATDTFFVQDGNITKQTFAAKVTPKS